MTPAQMLRSRGVSARPAGAEAPVRPPGSDHVDHVIRILEAPATQGWRIKRTEGEPWLLECIDQGTCPICDRHLLHMQSQYAPETHFYTCEEEPRTHRWTIIEG